MVASTWICAFGTLIPTWRGAWGQFGLDRDIGSCTIIADKNGTINFLFFILLEIIYEHFYAKFCHKFSF